MVLVLVVHADVFSLNGPNSSQSASDFTRMFFQCLSVTCVDIFILISGWFGINPNLKGFSKFIFQWLFFSVTIYLALAILGKIPFNIAGLLGCLKFNQGGYWFICSYIILYILSPMLNAGISSITRHQHKWIIICFHLFVFIYSWCFLQSEFAHGYSAICFIGLYVLARYVKIYNPKFSSFKKNCYLYIFAAIIIFNTLFLALAIYLHRDGIPVRMMMFYETPTTIMAALSLLIYFSKLYIKSNLINWVASSSFAVYLLHTHYTLLGEYANTVRHLYHSYDGIIALSAIGLFIIFVFIISILADQPRKFLWNSLWNQYEKMSKKNKH